MRELLLGVLGSRKEGGCYETQRRLSLAFLEEDMSNDLVWRRNGKISKCPTMAAVLLALLNIADY